MRRDHAKYLALIASLALLYQHQRKQLTRVRGGQSQQCVLATLDDVQTANRLAGETLAARFDALLPRTRQLLTQLDQFVTGRAQAEGIPRSDLRFTQRRLSETLGWSDRALRRQLARLVELEYVLVYPELGVNLACENRRTRSFPIPTRFIFGAPRPLSLPRSSWLPCCVTSPNWRRKRAKGTSSRWVFFLTPPGLNLGFVCGKFLTRPVGA